MERKGEKKEDKGTNGRIDFVCSEGDWKNITSLSPTFVPESEEDLVLSANVEALFKQHNDKAHGGSAKLKANLVTLLIPPKSN